MAVFSERLKKRIRAEERRGILEEFAKEGRYGMGGVGGGKRLSMGRGTLLAEGFGALLLAMITASFAVLVNFIIFAVILHVS